MNTYRPISPLIAASMAALVLWPSPLVFSQGSLTPPAAPAPTMKTLDQIESRTPITNLPYTINVPGSYYFVTNLTGGESGGITISASGVTLDLMGFELVGGTGAGIVVAGNQTNVAIRNGTVRSWSNTGVFTFFAKNSQLERLAVSANGGGGISAGNNTTIIGCTAASNSGVGILVLDGSVVKDCAAQSNTGNGFQLSGGCTVSDCSASSNQGGIQVGDGSTVSGCTTRGNTVNGIMAGEGCTVNACTARSNGQHGITTTGSSTVSGCNASSNTVDGINFGSSCRIVDNMCQGNGLTTGGAGIHATASRNRIDSNTVMGNLFGIDSGVATANLIIRNSARGNTGVNYLIQTGNNSGAIIVSPGVGFSATNPWANFEF